jgi:hypothetical protein
MTIIGSLPRIILRFDRLGSGHYRATTGETQHHTCYSITRVDHRLWLAEMERQQPDGTCDLVARNTVSVLKIAMRWCEDAARAEAALRPLTTIYRSVPGHIAPAKSVRDAAAHFRTALASGFASRTPEEVASDLGGIDAASQPLCEAVPRSTLA